VARSRGDDAGLCKKGGIELGTRVPRATVVVNDKNRAGYGYGSALLCSLCGEETWILAWARARTSDGRVGVRIAWHHNRLTENTDLFYLSKRVGEETSVMNVDCRMSNLRCELVRRDMYQEW
jgi:hypothetical protein